MEDINWLDSLLTQLNAVQNVAEHQFWLTTEELALLLGFNPSVLEDPQTQQIIMPQFDWRNFACRYVGQQSGVNFWTVLNSAQSLLHDSFPHRQGSSSILSVPKAQVIVSPNSSQGVLPSKFIQIDQFLPEALVTDLLNFAIAEENNFSTTSVSTDISNYRRSMFYIAFTATAISNEITSQIRQVMPQVMRELNIPSFQVVDIESQLTMHNDGNFYRIHNDNGSPETATRVFTYVYYFNRQPKAYSGGELRIFDTKVENNFYVGAESFIDVDPRHNSIVFFLSRYLHEVLPVNCPSRQFSDSRFTVNGWIRSPKPLSV